MNSKKYEESDYDLDLDFANHLTLITWSMSWEKWLIAESNYLRPIYLKCVS